jgi:LPXTG-motif cell wall-anchored protein
VSVPEEDEGDGSSTLLPIAGLVILLVIVVAGYMFSRRGTQETT